MTILKKPISIRFMKRKKNEDLVGVHVQLYRKDYLDILDAVAQARREGHSASIGGVVRQIVEVHFLLKVHPENEKKMVEEPC